MHSTLARLLVSLLLLIGVAQAQEQPFFVQFKIEPTSGENGYSAWLATYQEKNTKATFIIEIERQNASSQQISFAKGAIRRVAGSQSDAFLKSLSIALGGQGKIPFAKRVNRLPLELAVLGTKQSRVPHDGGFTSRSAGDWMTLKAFLANGDGEVYLNLNPEKGIGEFSLKDEGYAEVVLREVASVL